jgi:hypothetical protein
MVKPCHDSERSVAPACNSGATPRGEISNSSSLPPGSGAIIWGGVLSLDDIAIPSQMLPGRKEQLGSAAERLGIYPACSASVDLPLCNLPAGGARRIDSSWTKPRTSRQWRLEGHGLSPVHCNGAAAGVANLFRAALRQRSGPLRLLRPRFCLNFVVGQQSGAVEYAI